MVPSVALIHPTLFHVTYRNSSRSLNTQLIDWVIYVALKMYTAIIFDTRDYQGRLISDVCYYQHT